MGASILMITKVKGGGCDVYGREVRGEKLCHRLEPSLVVRLCLTLIFAGFA